MNREVLAENLSLTLRDMEVHTGKKPGGPTGFCQSVVIGALTGIPLDWGLGKKLSNEDRESRVGLECDDIKIIGNARPLDAVVALLEQDQLRIDAVLINGQKLGTRDVTRRHMIAVIPTEGPVYRVVDSLLPGAVRPYIDIASVITHLKGSLEPTNAYLRVVPSIKERDIRRDKTVYGISRLRVARGVSIEVPQL